MWVGRWEWVGESETEGERERGQKIPLLLGVEDNVEVQLSRALNKWLVVTERMVIYREGQFQCISKGTFSF